MYDLTLIRNKRDKKQNFEHSTNVHKNITRTRAETLLTKAFEDLEKCEKIVIGLHKAKQNGNNKNNR